MPNDAEAGFTNGHSNERTGLLNGDSGRHGGGSQRWSRRDDRFWVWIPCEAGHLTYATLASNYINILLVFVPLGLLSGFLKWSPTATFVLNFIAIMPLASLLSFATEELASTLGETLGGLLNATFGNAVELIVSIVALSKNEIRIVQSSMLGSVLSNILLVLGCCFFFGGINYHEQSFNSTAASTMSSMMTVASASLIIPSTLYASLSSSKADSRENILFLSHGTAIILLIVYIMYLFFQLRSHPDLFESPNVEANDSSVEEEEEERILNPYAASILLLIITVLVSGCAEYLVGSIEPIVQSTGMSRTFIGLILIPIVGNAAEHVTAVVVACKNKMDLAIGVAIGSSLQIALFVTPFLVILGWIMDKDMTLHFQTFETVAFFISGLVVTILIQDGKSNYLEGGLCLGMYVIIAIGFYVYPDDAGDIGAVASQLANRFAVIS
ncbi:calcium/proton exchanger [Trichophyton soudanense CBS 452.61]|uniref:Vacuolar calcium ion transporter n=1 Tax=Trichophyton soudanense CBS 452.61 TaxID=1215331 RepID=A0A022XWJ6_TRISD|nr:calcium/proton exchanger [Trichophyton soudanense CBS 452.61]EZG01749.1 calcium/proton exchanger [Trichophyton rubrum CBS 735.88]